MAIPSTTNINARSYVLKCAEFNGVKNEHSDSGYAITGRKIGHLYAVYSYGYWPLFVCDTRTDTWFINADKCSSTTSKHRSQCYPLGKDCAPLPRAQLDEMLSMAVYGWRPQAAAALKQYLLRSY
jgi:hypothetical protein